MASIFALTQYSAQAKKDQINILFVNNKKDAFYKKITKPPRIQ